MSKRTDKLLALAATETSNPRTQKPTSKKKVVKKSSASRAKTPARRRPPQTAGKRSAKRIVKKSSVKTEARRPGLSEEGVKLISANDSRSFKLYVLGYLAKNDGSPSKTLSRILVDDQPKGGFETADDAKAFAVKRWGKQKNFATWAASLNVRTGMTYKPRLENWYSKTKRTEVKLGK